MLIEVQTAHALVVFDGRVLECFWLLTPDSARYHVSLIRSVDLKTDRSGQHTLEINLASGHQKTQALEDHQLGRARELVAALQQAIASPY